MGVNPAFHICESVPCKTVAWSAGVRFHVKKMWVALHSSESATGSEKFLSGKVKNLAKIQVQPPNYTPRIRKGPLALAPRGIICYWFSFM